MTGIQLHGAALPQWTDMSDYVAHFAKAGLSHDAYDVMMSILGSGRLRAMNRFGFARNKAPDPDSQLAVCFSETPLHLLARISEQRSEFGIVFKKAFLLSRGGNPVWYAYKGHPPALALNKLVAAAINDTSAPIWRVTPFVDQPGVYAHNTYFYEHEREWRVRGDLSFTPGDVAFLVLPEDSHEAAWDFFEAARDDNVGPCYHCPYIDAQWSLDRVAPLLAAAGLHPAG